MIDIEVLKTGRDRELPEALGKALRKFMKDNDLSTRDAGARFGIVHSNLAESRIYCLRGPDTLRALARCEDEDICVLARALLERLGISLSDFDLVAVENQLSPGVGLGFGPVADHRDAIGRLIQCFIRGVYFRQLATARAGGLRCTPLFPTGRLIETDYSFAPGDDPEAYCYEHYYGDGNGECRGSGRFLEVDAYDADRIRNDTTNCCLELARHENLFLLEAIENLTDFHHADTESKDELTAACAAVEAYVCYESMAVASSALRQAMSKDRLLARTPLGRIAAAIYEHARSNIDGVGSLCVAALAALPKGREDARTALERHARLLMGTIGATWAVTELADGTTVSALQR